MGLTKQQEEDIRTVSKKVFQDGLTDQTFMNSFADKLADMVFSKLSDKIECLNNKIVELNGTVDKVSKINTQLVSRVEELEQKIKLSQLRMYGVKEKKGENITDVVNNLLEEKGIVEQKGDIQIVSCYRIGTVKSGSKKPRPVILKFSAEYQRNIVFYNKKKLKGSKITLTEDLTKPRYNLLLKAKEEIGKENVWSQDGNICIKFNGQKHVIKTELELQEFIGRHK